MTLSRREFVGLIGTAAVAAAADQPHSQILIDSEDAARMRDFVKRHRAALADTLARLDKLAPRRCAPDRGASVTSGRRG